MQLSEIETAALRLAIARDDEDIRAALEVFRLENDAEDLMDTLRRIAQRVMRELGKLPNSDIFPRARNQQDGASQNAQGNGQEVSDEDQLDDDTEEGGDEEDADDEGRADGDGVLTTQGARQHIFPVRYAALPACIWPKGGRLTSGRFTFCVLPDLGRRACEEQLLDQQADARAAGPP
jgi:hypothetical protein